MSSYLPAVEQQRPIDKLLLKGMDIEDRIKAEGIGVRDFGRDLPEFRDV